MGFVRGGEVTPSAIEVRDKLHILGGHGPLKAKIVEAQRHLSKVHHKYWHCVQAKGRIKRFLYLAQRPKPEEVEDVRAAYALMAPENIKKHRAVDEALIQSIVDFAERAREVDQDFYRAHLEKIRIALVLAGLDEIAVGRIARPQT